MITHLLSAFGRARSVPSKGWKVLTTKQYKRMYKGKGAMKAGVINQYGRFLPVASMLPKYLVPDLTDFPLKPYVANYIEQKQMQRGGQAPQQLGQAAGEPAAAAAGSNSATTTP